MSVAAWIMLLVVVTVLFGGLTVCIAIAVTIDRKKREEGITFHHEGDE